MFLKYYAENELVRLVSDPFLFLMRYMRYKSLSLHEVKTGGSAA